MSTTSTTADVIGGQPATLVAQAASHGAKWRVPNRGRLAPYLFIAPYLVITLVFFMYPLINAIVLAFYQTNGPQSRVFVGLGNFAFLLRDPDFHAALRNTTVFAFFSIFLQLPLSLGLAMMLNSGKDKLRGFFRLIIFSPNLVGQIFVGILFGVLFTPRYGLINRFFHALFYWGLEERWLENSQLVMPAMILTSLWLYVGFNMVYFLAALQNVDRSLIEAARIDGANPWQVFRHVTVPSIRHVTTFVVIMSIIGSYQLFELPLALLSGSNGFGPNNSGVTLLVYLNNVAFNQGDLGMGSAAGWILTLIIFVISLVQIKLTGSTKE